MDQHGVRLRGRSRTGNRDAIKPEVERLLRLVAERKAAQRAVARDGMSAPFHPMANVVKPGRERLPDACAVVAMPGSMHAARDDGSAQQPLAIDRRLVRSRPDGVAETDDLTPSGRCEQVP